MYVRNLVFVCILALAACGGGGGGTSSAPGTVSGGPGQLLSSSQLVPTSFSVGLAATTTTASVRRGPAYVGAGSASVQITLNTVNGGAPPIGLTTTVNSSITPASCPCSVNGPLVPPGSDAFTFTTYDGANATGNVVASFSNTFTIVAGSANSGNTVTLLGVPKTFTISGVPSGTAGTAFGSPATIAVAVKDADGNAITGTYANAVTISDNDGSGAQGSQVAVNGGAFGASASISQSSDVVKLNYGGLAIRSVTLTASASGASSGTAPFAPVLSPIVYSGPLNGSSAPEIDLFAPTGTGSTGTFSASEVGWTNSPYNKPFDAVANGQCSTIGAISPASGTSFVFTAVGSPAVGICSITINDNALQGIAVTGTYTSSGFGVN